MPEFETVLGGLQYYAQHKGNDPAFIFRDPQGGRHVQTFEQVYRLGCRFAAQLKATGVGRGQLVINTLPNCPERVVCEAGTVLSGAASVNAQCLLADGSDLLSTIRVSRASTILVDPDVTHSPWNVLEKHVTQPEEGRIVSEELPDLKRVLFVRRIPQSGEDFLTKLDASADSFHAEDIGGDDVCSVFTTSGSSGFSKLVAHTHRNIVEAIVNKNPVHDGLSGDEVDFSMAPLGWMGGYFGNNVLRGSVRVLCDTRNGLPTDLLDFMLTSFKEEKVNMTFVPAPRLNVLLDRVRQMREKEGQVIDSNNPGKTLHILDRITLGGQPITRGLVQTASQLARKVFILYGSTETFLISSFTVPDPDSFKDHDCGTVVTGGHLKIVSHEDESVEMPTGKMGHILFKRTAMMKGYLYDAETTSTSFTADGFFRTGDIGYQDERGHVIVEGRGSDAIMRGQYIFYPGWLEERIRACPGVRDVMVVGVPDPGANEEICACVMVKSEEVTVEQVQDFVEKDIVVSDEEPLSPRPRHYLKFDSFPVTSTGKPARKVIKQQATARLSVSSDD